jgi:hypothetical protein
VVITTASFISDLWNDQLVEHGRQYHFLVLVGFLGSFGFIRLSTRLMRSPKVPWWPGSVVSEGGLHVHHHVFGIVTMMIAGVVSFALWLHLDDVYWSKEGRSSIDATLIAAGFMGLILLGAAPYEVTVDNFLGLIIAVAGFVLWGALVLVCFAKQRFFHGLAGVVFAPLAIYGASRLGKPGSTWARRFYGTRRPEKQAKAEQRFRPDRRTEQLKKVVRDAVGGTPTDEYETKLGAAPPPGSE